MPADLYLFMDDMLHFSKTTNTLTASTTAAGYHKDFVREPDLTRAWKPTDGAGDEFLEFDPATDSDVGVNPNKIFACVAYDARGSNQNTLRLQRHTGVFFDDMTHAIDKTRINCYFFEFTMPATPYTKYRLSQLNSDRSGGTVIAKIYSWGMFNQSDVIRLSLDYPTDGELAYRLSNVYRCAVGKTIGHHLITNEVAKPGQAFTVRFNASLALYQRLAAEFDAIGGLKRAIYVQKTELHNPGKADFFLCRMSAPTIEGSVRLRDLFEIEINFETMPWL